MPRQSRIVVPSVPHHVTQRGNRRQQTFFRDGDYLRYLQLAAEWCAKAEVECWSYCLMPNHVHLILTQSTRHPRERTFAARSPPPRRAPPQNCE